MDVVRITELQPKTYVEQGDYIAIDNQSDGTKKVQFTNLLDDTLSQENKIAPANVVGDEIATIRAAVGSPLKASTVAQMTDTNKIYVYVGSETGYTNGNWYYWNGSAWTSGGVYNSVAVVTDPTLTLSGVPADAKATGDEVTNLKSDLSGVTLKMVEHKSNNLLKSDSDYTQGKVEPNGNVGTAQTLGYTRKIDVSEGDIVRMYYKAGGSWGQQSMRYVCAYDADGNAVSASGGEYITDYTVPSGIVAVIVTFYFANTQFMLTINYEATAYEAYFIPYYTAQYDFIADVLPTYEVPTEPVKGYNLLKIAQTGVGSYYGSSVGSPINHGSSSTYKYAIMPVKQNTVYAFNLGARFWAFTDDNDIVTSYGEDGLVHNSGNGTKLYYTTYSSYWDWESQYGSTYALIVSEGYYATYKGMEKPAFISNLSQNMMDAKYGCALPKKEPRFTVGIDQVWYDANILALESNKIEYVVDVNDFVLGGQKMSFASPASTSANYYYRVYDEHLACIAQQIQKGYKVSADNVQNCSALVIGDSTVAQNHMTQTMLDAFAERNKTLTLLGTRGTAPNKHEGRAGWSTYDYCTQASKGGITNPFYNNGFDFSYYMTNQGYSAPDFVVLQLGINDLYNLSLEDSQSSIEGTADRLTAMLNSIWSYNASQKVILNLPTALNSDQTKQYHRLFVLRNIFVRYNEYIQYRLLDMPVTKVRVSNCHLILNPDEDISDDVHPTQAGYTKIGMEVVSQINCWQNN